MVTVVIIGLLASIAVPSYFSMLSSSRRNDGTSDLRTVMSVQEKYFLNNTTYTNNLGKDGLGFGLTDGKLDSPKGHYEITAERCRDIDGNLHGDTTRCIRLVATAKSSSDPDFWLQSDGQKSDLMP
jgi:type IV pilus assembly protein PilE